MARQTATRPKESSRSRTSDKVTATPISFRMPPGLRSRLKQFAKERSLGEAEAIRLALSDHFNEADEDRELAAAERWQFEEAYATWQEHLKRGRADTVPLERIHEMLRKAIADIEAKRGRG